MALAETIIQNSRTTPMKWTSGNFRALDVFCGSILTIYFLLSTILNPIVFYHYWKLPSTVPNILYRLLAISDFVTNLARPLMIAVDHFSPFEDVSLSVLIDSNVKSVIMTVSVRVSMTMSFTTVAFLALTRAIKIQWPFFHIKKRLIYIWISLIAAFISVVMVLNMAAERNVLKNFVCAGAVIALQYKNISEEGQNGTSVHADASILSRISFLPMYFHAIIAVVVSIWAVIALAKTIRESKVTKNTRNPSSVAQKTSAFQRVMIKFKGCGAIIIMNLANIILIVSLVSLVTTVRFSRLKYSPDDETIDYCHFVYAVQLILPTLIAATNPLILMKFNLDLRKRVLFWR